MNHKRNRRKKDSSPKWMTTYADMITLILVFFILLFSMSQINLVKFETIAESFRNRMIFDFYPSPIESKSPTEKASVEENGNKNNEFETAVDQQDQKDEISNEGKVKELDQLKKEIDQYLKENGMIDMITATKTERGVVLVLEEQLLFESGRAEVLDRAKPFLEKVGTLLMNIPHSVKVEGHTDNRSIHTFRYPSNWELSGARASSVIRYLLKSTDSLNSKRFTAVAYGSTRPVVPNTSEENWGKNRRVEIVIMDPEYQPRHT